MYKRSFIALKTDTGFKGVYCHWDGYLEHVGRVLRRHYTDPAKVAELIEHDDISILDQLGDDRHGDGPRLPQYLALTTTFPSGRSVR